MIKEISKSDAYDRHVRLRLLIIASCESLSAKTCLRFEITVWEVDNSYNDPSQFIIQMNLMHPMYTNINAIKEQAQEIFDKCVAVFRLAPSIGIEIRLVTMSLKDILSAMNNLFKDSEIIMSPTTICMLSLDDAHHR